MPLRFSLPLPAALLLTLLVVSSGPAHAAREQAPAAAAASVQRYNSYEDADFNNQFNPSQEHGISFAADDPGSGGPTPDNVPVDGGTGLLALLGAAYAARQLRQHR